MLWEIADYIHDGAKAFFLTKEYIALSVFVVGMCVLVGALFAVLENCCLGPNVLEVQFVQTNFRALKLDQLSGLWVVISLLLDAIFSAAAGWLGMFIVTKANIRTTHVCRAGMGPGLGLSVAFKSGAVMGLTVCCLGITGLSILHLTYSSPTYFLRPWTYIAGFGFGASSIALFARVGGGVYTKAADVGADLVGKVENNIPEDDVRNPAVIADNVDDNVGDVAGMGVDLFESYCGSIIAACSLAAVTVVQTSTQSCNTKCPETLNSDAAKWRGCIYGIPSLGAKPSAPNEPTEYWFEYCPAKYGMDPLHTLLCDVYVSVYVSVSMMCMYVHAGMYIFASVYIHVYVCMHVCIYMYLYVFVYRMHICMSICVHVCTCLCMCGFQFMCIYVCECVYVHMMCDVYVCELVCMTYVCVHVYV